jgi:hypothetical protein
MLVVAFLGLRNWSKWSCGGCGELVAGELLPLTLLLWPVLLSDLWPEGDRKQARGSLRIVSKRWSNSLRLSIQCAKEKRVFCWIRMCV